MPPRYYAHQARHRTSPPSKVAKQRKFAHEMRKFYAGELHSGSKRGPVVHSPEQAKAIAAHVSGLARRR